MDSYIYQANYWFQYSAAELLLALVWLLAVYFLPAFIAFRRRHKNRIAILVINIFLGFSIVGWLVAAAWALTGEIELNEDVDETAPKEQRPRVPPTLDKDV